MFVTSDAPLNVSLQNRWSIYEEIKTAGAGGMGDDQILQVRLKEEVWLSAPAWLRWYIGWTMGGVHEEIMRRIEKKVAEMVKGDFLLG